MYTYKQIKESFPKEKQQLESLYGRIICLRPISYMVTVPLINLGFNAWDVSILSIIIAIIGCTLISINNFYCMMIGTFLIPLWHILDCVDGNIARVKKTASMLGSFTDACSGYFVMSFLPLALGIAAYNTTNYVNDIIFIIIGALASTSGILMRLIHQKYAYTLSVIENKENRNLEKGDNPYKLSGFHKFRKKIDIECSISGLPMFFLMICPFFRLYNVLVIYFFGFHILSLILGSIYYLKKAK